MGDLSKSNVRMEQRISAGGLCASFFYVSLPWASPEQSLTVTWRAGGMVGWWWVVSCHVLLVRVSTNTSRYVVAIFGHHVFGVLSSSHGHVVVGRCRVVVLTLFFACRHVVFTSSCRCRRVVVHVALSMSVCSGICVAGRCQVHYKTPQANSNTGATLRKANKPGSKF